MKVLTPVKKAGKDFKSFEIELDSYPEEPFRYCTFISSGDLYELMYEGGKLFKLIAVNDNYSLSAEINIKKGTIIDEH